MHKPVPLYTRGCMYTDGREFATPTFEYDTYTLIRTDTYTCTNARLHTHPPTHTQTHMLTYFTPLGLQGRGCVEVTDTCMKGPDARGECCDPSIFAPAQGSGAAGYASWSGSMLSLRAVKGLVAIRNYSFSFQLENPVAQQPAPTVCLFVMSGLACMSTVSRPDTCSRAHAGCC